MKKQTGWRLSVALIESVKGHARALNETLEQYVEKALTIRLSEYNTDNQAIYSATDSEYEANLARTREIVDGYILDAIERRAIIMRNDCRSAVLKELPDTYGCCAYFTKRMKEMGYKSKKVRLAEYDNPVNIWLKK